MNALGLHLILELRECNALLLDDLTFLRDNLINAAHSMGATIVGQTFHKFSPQGVTGVVAIAESHLCIHTWPEYRYAALDIFSCGEQFDCRGTAQLLVSKLEAKDYSITELQRGFLSELAGTTD